MSIIHSKIWFTSFKNGIILAVLKHSGKIPSDNKLLNSIETVGTIIGPKIFIYKYQNIHEVGGFVLLPMN